MRRDVDLREHIGPFSFRDSKCRHPRVGCNVGIQRGTDEDVGESTWVKAGRDVIG